MSDLQARYPLDHLNLAPTPSETPELLLSYRKGLAFCQVMASRGQAQATAAALDIPAGARIASSGDRFTALPLAPGQWLLCAPWGRDGRFTEDIAQRVRGIGHASEQSHGRAAFRVRGPSAATLLDRECRLDLDPAVAPTGFVGQTIMADIGVLIHKLDDTLTFDLIVHAGYAEHFIGWLDSVAQPFNPTFAEEIVA